VRHSPEIQRILDQVYESGITYLDLQFTDVMGMVKTVSIATRQLESALAQGVWFDGSAIEGFARVAESDMYLRPDLKTFTVIPWEQQRRKVGRLICNVYTPTGDPFPGDPRAVLQRAILRANELGYRYRVSPELEFYLFRQPSDPHTLQVDDQVGYFDLTMTEGREVRHAITDTLEGMGILVESGHHEVGPGQHEIDLAPLDALDMADAVMTARLAVKSIAQQFGLLASFMPKPLARMAGSGMHVHQQLLDLRTGANVFADPHHAYTLSTIGQSFLAGQLTHARGICAILAPLVNSYKRLVTGHEAPVYITWAQLNRSALVRVPRAIPEQPELTRLELRAVDPSCNPYLAFAAMLRAGLDGIERGLEAPPPAEEELYAFNARRRQLVTLPTSLSDALVCLEESDLASDALGLHVYERFLEAKRLEWGEYVLEVSPWERERYLRAY
jgi:glutamine synthetase